MPRRWDGDERGHGVGDAAQLVAGAGELVAAFSQSAWVAEQPEIHLRPHIETWCQRDRRLTLIDDHPDDTGAYTLDLEWGGATGSVGEARAAIFSLIGSFAESATYVRQRRVSAHGDGSTARLQFEVGTGELALDTRCSSWPRRRHQRGRRALIGWAYRSAAGSLGPRPTRRLSVGA